MITMIVFSIFHQGNPLILRIMVQTREAFFMIGKEIPVTFTYQGMQIIGVLHRPPSSEKPPGVVFHHGCTGSKIEAHWFFVKLARHLAAQGIMTLRFDFRGSGESEGEFEDMTLSGEIADGLCAFDYLVTGCGADPERTGVLGLSMGGTVAAIIAGRLAERVKSCVLLNPVARPLEDCSFIAQSRGIDVSRLQKDALRFPVEYNCFLFGKAFFEELSSIRPLEEISRAACPVLIVNGSGDTTLSPLRSQEYFDVLDKRRIPTELFVLKGADHTFASCQWEQAVIEKVGGWFEKTLLHLMPL
jgi:uncharacterized protein